MLNLTLAEVRATGRPGQTYTEVNSGHVYTYQQIRDGSGFVRGTVFAIN